MIGQVILFPSSIRPVGVAVHVLELASALVKNNIQVLVLCLEHGWLDFELKKRGIPCRYITAKPTVSGMFRGNYSLYRELKGIQRPAVLHLHGRLPLFCAILARILLPQIRQVCTVHQFYEVYSPEIFDLKGKLELALLRWQKCIVVVSDALRKEVAIRTKLNPSCILVVPNFIADVPDYKNRPHRAYTSNLRLVAIGRLAPEKGFDLAIQALGMTRDVNCTLDIIGEGPQRAYLESLIGEVGLEDRVKILGEVSGAARLLSIYDAIVVPSRSESFGIVVLEAYRAGVPVIATSVRGLSDVVTFDSAILVEPESPKAIAKAIRMFASDSKLRADLGDAGRRRFEEVFEMDKSVRIVLSIYKNMLHSNVTESSQ